MDGKFSIHGEMINAYKILISNPEEKRLLGRPRCRRKDNIKMDLKCVRIGFSGGILLIRK
jgi:hypothetical protein